MGEVPYGTSGIFLSKEKYPDISAFGVFSFRKENTLIKYHKLLIDELQLWKRLRRGICLKGKDLINE
jgi:hypothetical protein